MYKKNKQKKNKHCISFELPAHIPEVEQIESFLNSFYKNTNFDFSLTNILLYICYLKQLKYCENAFKITTNSILRYICLIWNGHTKAERACLIHLTIDFHETMDAHK